MIDTNEFLSIVAPAEAKENFRLGTIKNNKIQFDGEETASKKDYKILNNITLTEGDRVLLIYISGTHIVLGKI